MNRLDLMPQAPSRLAEPAQTPRGPSGASDAQQGGKGSGSGTAGFDTLLEGFSREQSREATDLLQDGSLLNLSEQTADTPAADTMDLQALLSTTSATAAAPPAGSQAYFVLESLLPRILSQTGAGGEAHSDGRNGASSMLPMLASDATADSILSPAMGPKMSVTVQNQETHFRPVVEGFEQALQGSSPDGSGNSSMEVLPEHFGTRETKGVALKLPAADLQEPSGDRPVGTPGETGGSRQSDEERSFERVASSRMADRTEAQKQTPPGLQKADGASLPAGTLHQMARAILDDVSELSKAHQPSFQGDGVHRVAVARASGGVLRVLSLQLNPVELGLVTVKMRLSGDSLEMELQVEKQETAELLRNDAEKLSSLLRTSGYRPDVITIQAAEPTSHDRHSFQRLQQEAPDQDFQGNADGQSNSSGQHHGPNRREEAELRNGPKQDRTSDRSSSGGVYL